MDKKSRDAKFEELKFRTITAIKGAQKGSESIEILCSDGTRWGLSHYQDCCENVQVEEVIGDLSDIVGEKLTLAEEVSNSGTSDQDYTAGTFSVKNWPRGIAVPEYVSGSFTWTFYKLSTIKGSVTIRWLGESNGYYSEGVNFVEVLG